jgi:hypothetical protein
MGIVDDLKIEQAVAAALEASADQRALALVQIAVDPEGTKVRIKELAEATAAHDAACQAAEAKVTEAEAKVTEAERRETATNAWAEQTTKRLNERAAAADAAAEALANREKQCRNREAALAERETEHASLMARLRLHLDQFAGEART